MKTITSDRIRELHRLSNSDLFEKEAKRAIDELDNISNGREDGNYSIIGEDGADRDEVVAILNHYGRE